MESISSSSKLYKDFVGINGGAYHTLVHFYESNAKGIATLKYDAYFEILINYTNALFEIGAYSKHLVEVDKVICFSIQENIQFYKGEDIYYKNLFQKAVSSYNILEYEKAEHILKELIKMSPYQVSPIRFLKKCLASSQPTYIKNARAASIFLFLTAALITAIEVIFIYPFAVDWASSFEYLRFSIFSIGVFVLIGAHFFHRWRINQIVNNFLVKIRSEKHVDM